MNDKRVEFRDCMSILHHNKSNQSRDAIDCFIIFKDPSFALRMTKCLPFYLNSEIKSVTQ